MEKRWKAPLLASTDWEESGKVLQRSFKPSIQTKSSTTTEDEMRIVSCREEGVIWVLLVPQYEYVSFDDLITQSDFILITASAGEDTVGVFNKKTFGKMKNDAILINISR